MIDYIKLNHFYLFKQFILLFKFQGFISTYIPTYIIKYTNNCKCMSVGYTNYFWQKNRKVQTSIVQLLHSEDCSKLFSTDL